MLLNFINYGVYKMNVTDKTILRTPLDILEASKTYFPGATIDITFTNPGQFFCVLCLSQRVSQIRLDSAIETTSFLKSIKKISLFIQGDKFCQANKTYTLDSNSFSVYAPLSDWQKFRRVAYEASGVCCDNLLMLYLRNIQQYQQQISNLGLAPEQLEGDQITEEDLAYFYKLADKLETLEVNQKKELAIALQKQYPIIFRQLHKQKIQTSQKEDPGIDVYQKILESLNKHVIGQSKAVKNVASILTSQKNHDGNQTFLFVGPSGVGKTELAKAASTVKGDNRFIRFDMNKYMDETHANKLFGSGTGYVGSTDKPHFAKEIDLYGPKPVNKGGSKKTYEVTDVVLLFDEFEKAHTKVKQSLLTLFDEGYCEVEYTEGRENVSICYQFKKCIIVSTSNLFHQHIMDAFNQEEEYEKIVDKFKKLNNTNLSGSSFSPELLNRMFVVPFNPIPRGECYQTLLKIKLLKSIPDTKSIISCREIEIDREKENLILSALEIKLYREGIDIRRVEDYFKTIRTVVYSNREKISPLGNKKILLTFVNERPCLKFFETYQDWGTYEELDDVCLAFPGF